jgi:hypothetical protein
MVPALLISIRNEPSDKDYLIELVFELNPPVVVAIQKHLMALNQFKMVTRS